MTCIKITESQNGQIYPEDTFSHGAAHIISSLLQMSLFFSNLNQSKDIKNILEHAASASQFCFGTGHMTVLPTPPQKMSTSEYSSTDVPLHLISALPVRSKREQLNQV